MFLNTDFHCVYFTASCAVVSPAAINEALTLTNSRSYSDKVLFPYRPWPTGLRLLLHPQFRRSLQSYP